MPLEVRKTDKLLNIFGDLHGKQRNNKLEIEVAFALDPQIEGMAAAFYMDGSASMNNSGSYGRSGGLFGLGRQKNSVEEAMRISVPYVAGKDANGMCRVVYWATGDKGQGIEVIGEMTGEQAQTAEFDGPKEFGGGTYLLPAVRDFVAYIQQVSRDGQPVRAALGVIVTDGQFHDFDDVRDYTRKMLVPAIADGKFPRTVFTVVGVGKDVDAEQMEELMHEATPESYKGRPIWCYALADHVSQLPELVSHLIEANTPAFWGGAVFTDPNGAIVQTFEDMVPAVVKFALPLNARSFNLRVGKDTYTQTLQVVEADHEE